MSRLPDACVASLGEVLENLAFLIPMGTCDPPAPADWAVVLEVRFEMLGGSSTGTVWVALTTGAAAEAARNLLGLDPGAEVSHQDRWDTAAEVANVVAGNLLPLLHGDGAGFNLGQPTPVAASDLPPFLGACLDLGSGILGVAIEPMHP